MSHFGAVENSNVSHSNNVVLELDDTMDLGVADNEVVVRGDDDDDEDDPVVEMDALDP